MPCQPKSEQTFKYTFNIVVFLFDRRIKASLLPNVAPVPMSYSTGVQQEVNMPVFNETFQVPIPETKLSYKTLQVQVWCVQEDGDEECLVSCNCMRDSTRKSVLYQKKAGRDNAHLSPLLV